MKFRERLFFLSYFSVLFTVNCILSSCLSDFVDHILSGLAGLGKHAMFSKRKKLFGRGLSLGMDPALLFRKTGILISAFLILAVHSSVMGQDEQADSKVGVGKLARDISVKIDGVPAVIPDNIIQSIHLGQKYLKKRQASDGSFHRGNGTASVAIGTLALMVNGSVPGCGPHGKEVAKGVDYLIKKAQSSGLIAIKDCDGGIMYHHALSTLCLAEVWGMTVRNDIKPVLKRAVELIIRSQNREGGWRYAPRPRDADVSVTVMQIVALRAAQNAGISVPEQTIKDAVNYVKRCYDKEREGFKYQPDRKGVNVAKTAAGVLSLQLCGLYESEEVKKGCKYISRNIDKKKEERWFFYGQYYAMQAMYQSRRGEDWTNWYFGSCKKIMAKQKKSGRDIGGYRKVYQTGMAALAVGLPYRYLPIYQR